MSRARDTADQINRVNSSAADATAITVDSSENVLIGTTNANIYSTTTTGINLNPDGATSFNRNGGQAAMFNRINSDGDIVQFRKDGATVGNIGSSNAGERLYMVNDSTGLSFIGDFSNIFPCDSSGTARDNAINLGGVGGRFKDLYLSGGVYLGGTGAANKLDDAEYGVWNPGNYNIVLASTNGNYVKVGRMCTVAFRIVWPTNSNTAQAKISLPFACASHGSTAHMAGLAIAFTTYTNTPSGGVYSGGTFMEFFKTGSSSLTNADLSGKQINGSVTYITNS